MKEICVNCAYFDTLDIDNFVLDKGFCLMKDLYTFVDDDESCDEFTKKKESKCQ